MPNLRTVHRLRRAAGAPSAFVLGAAFAGALGCAQPAPIVNVEAPPCKCECAFRATAPEIGRGCHVQGDVLVCPLVRRTLEIEPVVPSEDPRCQKLPDGTTRCEVMQP